MQPFLIMYSGCESANDSAHEETLNYKATLMPKTWVIASVSTQYVIGLIQCSMSLLRNLNQLDPYKLPGSENNSRPCYYNKLN